MTRLRSITVSGFGCFDSERTVGPFADGVTLVHAPNGSGKSTLVRALAMALFDSHRTGGEDVKALRPWGRSDLAPTVALTLETGGRTLRVTKRFLDSPFARLEELADDGTTWRETLTADPAVEEVRALLMGQPAGRGLTKAEHWGMGRVLIARQDGLAFGGVDGDAPLESRLRDALGQARARATDPDARRLRDEVNADAATFFTDKGAVKSGKGAPPAARLAKELAAVEAALADARARLARFDAVSTELDAARSDAAGLDARHAAAVAAATAAAENARALDRLRAAAAATAARHRVAEATLAALEKTARAETAADRESADRDADAARAEAAHPAAAAAEAAARTALETARAALTAATAAERDGSPELVAARAEAAAAEAWLAAETTRAARADALTRAEAAHEALVGLRARYAALGRTPDAAAMTALRAADAARREARQALAAAMATLTFTPEATADPARLTTLRVVEGDPTDASAAGAPAGAMTALGAPAAAIAVPGLGVFRARVPSDSGSADRRRAVESAEAEFDRLRASYAAGSGAGLDLPALEARHAEAAALKQEGQEAAAGLAGLLGVTAPRPGPDDLAKAMAAARAEAATAAATVTRLLADHPAWSATPPDATTLAAARARATNLAATARKAADTARTACEPAERAHREAAAALTRAGAAAESARREATAAAARLTAARDEARRAAEAAMREHPAETAALTPVAPASATGPDHAALLAVIDRLNRSTAHDLRDAEAALAAVLATAPASPATAEADPDALAALRDERRTARDRLAGELAALGDTAPYAAVAAAEESVAILRADLVRETRRMEASRLLKQLFDAVDAEARTAVSGPLADDATAWFHRLTGTPRLGAVRLGRGLTAEAVAPAALGGAESIDAAARLSGGEHEQLQLAVRLALARHLAAGAGVPFVMDDAMPATDAARFARVRDALTDAAAEFPVQILLFTCHPERYAGWDRPVLLAL